jgi:hypothetical protein
MPNSQGYIVSQSMWALDAVEDFTTAPIYTSAEATVGSGAPGELQNDYSQCFGSNIFSSSYAMSCNLDNIDALAIPAGAPSGALYYGARLYNPLTTPAIPPRAKTFAEYAVGNAAPTGVPNAYSVSAWVYVTSYPASIQPLAGNILKEEKRYYIASFASSDHPAPATGDTLPGTCSVGLFLTGAVGNSLFIGAETTISTSYGYITDIVTTKVPATIANRTVADQWNHVVCCYDATTPDIDSEMTDRFKIYLNGQIKSTLSQSFNYTGSQSPFYGEIHPSTGAIGNNASQNLDLKTLTGSGNTAYGANNFFLNNMFNGAIAEVSLFNYSLHSYDASIISEMYNNGCPPDMSKMAVFNNIAQRPLGWYRMGATQPPPDIYGPPVPLATSSGQIGPGDTEGSASWNPDTTGVGSRLVNAVATFWPDDKNYYVDGLYAQGDGYPTLDASLSAPADINMAFSASGPCNDGYSAPDKNTLIAAPIYNRKHSLGSVFSVAHFGWSVPKKYYPQTNDYQDRTLTMPIPEDSASITNWTNQWPIAPAALVATNPSVVYPLGKIQTCGGNAEWQAGNLAGSVKDGEWSSTPLNPSYNSYDDYNLNMRLRNQDYSVIPEFIISDQINFYLNKQGGDFLAPNHSQFAIKGSPTASTSGIPGNSSDIGFYEVFSNSDFLRHFSVIKEDHRDFASPSSISLRCKALMKFLPYDGFFPSERALQIANQFSKSYGNYMEYSGLDSNLTNARFRPFLTPFFRPGIIFNTIKSGIAVDFPIYTSSYQVINYKTYAEGANELFSDYYALGTQDAYSNKNQIYSASWDLRIPFEAAVEPEKYIKDVLIFDLEPHPSSAIDVQAKWTGEGDKLYKRQISNFFAAIPEFWLANGELTSLKSKPESEFLTVQSGTTYGMRVKVKSTMTRPRLWRSYNSNDSVLPGYEVPQHPRNLTGDAAGLKETFTMYSRPSAFGPPVAGTTYLGFRDSVQPTDDRNVYYNTDLFPSDSLMGINPSFCPAPMGGEAWADIIYKARTSGQVTLDEIFSEATVNLWRIDSNPILTNEALSSVTGTLFGNVRQQAIWSTNENPAKLDYSSPMKASYANAYAMQLDASFNLLGKEGDRWVIEPKMETPHYNFNSETSIRPILSSSGTLIVPTNGSESVPRGMWHQFGTIETERGIYLEVGEIPERWRRARGYADPNRDLFNTEVLSNIDLSAYQNNKFRDLSKLVGFQNRKKMGVTADFLTVSEAVVAVPFVEKNGRKEFFSIPEDVIRKAMGDLNLISSDKSVSQAGLAVKSALQAIKNNEDLLDNLPDQKAAKVRAAAAAAAAAAANQIDRDEDSSKKVSDSIKDMVSKMKKFVFPPNMDFVNNLGKVAPFSMYIFEFDYQFTQEDLANMWQNTSPSERGVKFGRKEVEISHHLYANELMGSFDNDGYDPIPDGLKWMVFKVKQRANNNYFSKVSAASGPKAQQFPVSYNWPYDFFSLVEFVNIDTKIGFGDGLKSGDEDQRVAEVQENPRKVAKSGTQTVKRGDDK